MQVLKVDKNDPIAQEALLQAQQRVGVVPVYEPHFACLDLEKSEHAKKYCDVLNVCHNSDSFLILNQKHITANNYFVFLQWYNVKIEDKTDSIQEDLYLRAYYLGLPESFRLTSKINVDIFRFNPASDESDTEEVVNLYKRMLAGHGSLRNFELNFIKDRWMLLLEWQEFTITKVKKIGVENG